MKTIIICCLILGSLWGWMRYERKRSKLREEKLRKEIDEICSKMKVLSHRVEQGSSYSYPTYNIWFAVREDYESFVRKKLEEEIQEKIQMTHLGIKNFEAKMATQFHYLINDRDPG